MTSVAEIQKGIADLKEKLQAPIIEVQEKQKDLQKNYDSLSKQVQENAVKHADELLKELEGLKSKLEAREKAHQEMESRCVDLEKRISRASANPEKIEDLPELQKSLDNFLRFNEKPTRDMHEKCAKALVEFNIKTDNDMKRSHYEKDLVEGSSVQGGFWVPPQLSNQIITRIFETSPIMRVAEVVTTSSNEYQVIIDDNEDSTDDGWVGEVTTRSETTTPDIGLLKIPVHEQYAKPKISLALLEDAGFDVEAWLVDKASMRLNRRFNTSTVTGDGSQKPRGFTTYPASADSNVYERGKIGQLETAGSGTIAATDLVALQGLLKEEYQQNAMFAMQRLTFSQNILSLQGSDGQFIFNRDMFFRGGEMQLLGSPVVFMNDLAAVAAGNLSVAYADFRKSYTVVQRLGFLTIRDDVTTSGFTKIFIRRRIGGDVTSYDAIKLLKIKT